MKDNINSFEENMKSFGKYELLVRTWCKKHNMCFVMEEFKELFEEIEELSKGER